MIFELLSPDHLSFKFPEHKKQIARLTYDQKMEWYSSRKPEEMIWLGNDPAFKRFWKWHVVIPVRFRRWLYRIKNFEVFKKYEHITEMKNKVKKNGI
jgi:hypothetical protein